MRCCLGHHSAVLWRASYGNGPTDGSVVYTVALYTMGPLYTVALYDGSVVHGGPLRPRARIVQIAGSARASACVCGGLACVARGGA